MSKIKILFLIHDLGQGGAEKVLINLVNNMDNSRFDISVIALFGGGVNEPFLNKNIHFHTVWKRMIPGNSKLMKMLTPAQLHRICVKDHYDIEAAYLEGPSARIVSGCDAEDTVLINWIHTEHKTISCLAKPFRTQAETIKCYSRFLRTVCVSNSVKTDFTGILPLEKTCCVKYNTVESSVILEKAKDKVKEFPDDQTIRMITVGSLKEIKGFDRLLRIMKRFSEEKRAVHLYILGKGHLKHQMEEYIGENNLKNSVTLLGYQNNPYKYISKCDLFVCSSYTEGFSTAATEALITGTPVCTVDVAGMREMLGDSEYGLITENDEEALYQGIRRLLNQPELLQYYRHQAEIRGKDFRADKTVQAVEEMFEKVVGGEE